MPYLLGLLIGVLLTILALFIGFGGNALRENLASEPQKIAKSDVASERPRPTLKVQEATR